MTVKLEKLVRIYSVDTSAFYNDEEYKLHKELLKSYSYREYLKKLGKKIDKDTDEYKKFKKQKEKLAEQI